MNVSTEDTETAVLASLVEWSADCPAWQRDAMRRLCEKDTLESTDIDALISICKSKSDAVPITVDHIRDPAAARFTVSLKRLHSVQHVNALAPSEELTFDKTGITVIYGDNGSGKSGYARILKKMCRARTANRTDNILPNIYDSNPGIPSATIDFYVNGQHRNVAWVFNQPFNSLLSAVSVFDSWTANIHVDQANDVAYTPFPLKILAGLAQASQMIKDRLNSEIDVIQRQTPETIKKPSCQPHTTVGNLLSKLNVDTKTEIIEQVSSLSQMEQDRLDQITSDLANDPVRAARQLLSLKTRIDCFITRLENLTGMIYDDMAQMLRTRAKDFKIAQLAAQTASTALFMNEPLPNVGSEVWRSLWEAARSYSEKEAYSSKKFPVTDHSAVCVLCQQDIQPEAAVRLNQFEDFIKNDSKRREEKARLDYENTLRKFKEAKINVYELKEIVDFITNDITDTNLGRSVRQSILSCLWRYRQIKWNHAKEIEPSYIAAPIFPIDAMRVHATNLESRANSLKAEAGSEARKTLIAEREELADRKWLGIVKADVLAEIDRLKQISALQEVLKDTTTNRITTKSTEVAEKLVTNALRAQFAKEVARLEIASLAIELKQEKSSYGIPRFKVALTRKPGSSVGDVLSEGEHRCVALAAFLAELATTDSKSSIVFDDPISSLDHMRREAVAVRLIEEAQHRQVIVFTHDIAFLFLLEQACNECDTKPHFAIRSISRGRDNAGFCNHEPPFKARPLTKVILSMETRLKQEKIHYERGNQAEWEKTVRSLQEQLRTTWERAVEEAVSPVLKRLSNKVMTPGLAKVTVITIQDCEAMRAAFGRCSVLLHSESLNLNKPLPEPAKIETEIAALRDWIDSIQQRQQSVKVV